MAGKGGITSRSTRPDIYFVKLSYDRRLFLFGLGDMRLDIIGFKRFYMLVFQRSEQADSTG